MLKLFAALSSTIERS